MKIVIPSKGRADLIGSKALRLFPDAVVCVGEDEADAYAKVTGNLLVHPANVVGIGPLRQWVLDHVDDPCVVMVDDDVYRIYSVVGFLKESSESPDLARAVVERTATLAQDAGVRVFGFNQAWDVRKYDPFKPVLLKSWAGGIIGVIGRELRYDLRLLLRADIDFCLQSLLHDRIVMIEQRWAFVHKRFTGSGGNARQRSAERHQAEIEYLLRKWGPHLAVSDCKSTTRLVVKVER